VIDNGNSKNTLFNKHTFFLYIAFTIPCLLMVVIKRRTGLQRLLLASRHLCRTAVTCMRYLQGKHLNMMTNALVTMYSKCW
jgi:hypothetical protein